MGVDVKITLKKHGKLFRFMVKDLFLLQQISLIEKGTSLLPKCASSQSRSMYISKISCELKSLKISPISS